MGLLVLGVGLLATFAIPIRTWRTGEQSVPALSLLPRGSVPHPPPRLWIDTDAACGHGRRTDPDDCIAILLLSGIPRIEIVGIWTVFGNASLEVTDRTTRDLAAALSASGRPMPAVHRGSAEASGPDGSATPAPAHAALRAALAKGPLTLVALGPLTNIAAAVSGTAELQANVAQLVAVMGRRPGHLFHPAEGAGGGILFGHGPVFRDFNFDKDPDAVTRTLAIGLPMTLIPYQAARNIQISSTDLDRLAGAGGESSWVAQRAREWLEYWRNDIGTRGFCPFDLLAAAYAADPGPFGCARVQAWVGKDSRLFIPLRRPTALLVGQEPTDPARAAALGPALYCPEVDAGLQSQLRLGLGTGP